MATAVVHQHTQRQEKATKTTMEQTNIAQVPTSFQMQHQQAVGNAVHYILLNQ
jgi:hypothetical protein